MAQSLGGLKLVTIAKGFRRGFRRPAPQTSAPLSCGADVFLGLYRAVRTAAGFWRRRGRPRGRTGRWPGLHRGAGKRGACQVEERAGWFSAPWSVRCLRWTRLAGGVRTPARPAPSARSSCRSARFRSWQSCHPPGFADVQKFVVSLGGAGVALLNLRALCGPCLRPEYFERDEEWGLAELG